MKEMSTKVMLLGIVGIFIFYIIVIFAGVAYFNDNPGGYAYTIDVEGLDAYQPPVVADITVPLPFRDGQQVFSDEELQYKSFGDWTSVIVVTPYGKMLAFQSVGGNLTDLHAAFFKSYPEGMRIQNITNESFSPILPFVPSDYTQRIGGRHSTREYSTIIYIPDSIRPLNPEYGDITFNLNLDAYEGMQHSIVGKRYLVTIKEVIPQGARNWTPVAAQIVQLG